MKPIQYGALILLGAIWGASFLFISMAVVEFGPLAMMFLRVLGAGLVLVVVARLMKSGSRLQVDLNMRTNWHKYLIVGLLNSALPFTLIAYSELKISASMASILNSTTPLFTALMAALWTSERLTGRKLLGALLGIAGVTILMRGSPFDFDLSLILAVLASLGAALCYGAGTVYASKHITGLPAIYASIVQLLGAAILLAPPAALAIPQSMPSTAAILALLALTVLSSSVAYLLYFFLLRHVGPTRTASVTFLVPVFGTVWGIIFLREIFTLGMLLGMLVILASVGLATGLRLGRQKPQPV